jgi:hypothetical protein
MTFSMKNYSVKNCYLETMIASLIFIATAVTAFSHLQRHEAGAYYQKFFGPAISLACRGKFEDFAASTEPFKVVNDFLAQKSQNFKCADLPPAPMGRTPIDGLLSLQTQYLLFAAGTVWAVTGVSWAALNYLAAALAAAFALSVYGVSRLLVPWPWAFAVTVSAAMASSNLGMMANIRDYSKAPFILGVIFFSGLLLKNPPDTRRAIWFSIGAGAVGGVGFGFRTDLLLALPFFAIVLLIFLVRSRFRQWFLTGLCALAYLLSFALVSAPILPSLQGGGSAGHVSLLGRTTPFNQPLGVTDQIYDIGDQYLDQDTFKFAQQYAAMNFHEAGPPPKFDPWQPEYLRYTARSLLDFARHFPADIMTRALAAVVNVLNSGVSSKKVLFYSGFAPLFDVGVVAFALAIALLLMETPALAVFFLTYVFYFGGSFALQFDPRHSFYLRFVGWLSAAVIVHWIYRLVSRVLTPPASGDSVLGAEARPLARTSAIVLSLVALLGIVLTGLRTYQQAHATQLFGRYLAAERLPVQFEEARDGEKVLLKPAGSLPAMNGMIVPASSTVFNSFYFVIALEPNCDAPEFELTVVYRKEPPFVDFSRSIQVALKSDGGLGGRSYILFAASDCAGECGAARFDGISLPASSRACLVKVEAIKFPQTLPLPLWLRLTPEWQTSPLYQTFRESHLMFIR